MSGDFAPWPSAPFQATPPDAAMPSSWRAIDAWPVSYASIEHAPIAQLCRELEGRTDWDGFEDASVWLTLALHWELMHQVSTSPVPVESHIQHYGQDNGYGEEEGPVGVTVSVVLASGSSSRGMWNDADPKQRLKNFQGELVLAGFDASQRHGAQSSFGYQVTSQDSVEDGLRRNFGPGFLAHWRASQLAPALEGGESSMRSPRF